MGGHDEPLRRPVERHVRRPPVSEQALMMFSISMCGGIGGCAHVCAVWFLVLCVNTQSASAEPIPHHPPTTTSHSHKPPPPTTHIATHPESNNHPTINRNEPHGLASWGESNPLTDYNHYYERLVNRLAAKYPDWKVRLHDFMDFVVLCMCCMHIHTHLSIHSPLHPSPTPDPTTNPFTHPPSTLLPTTPTTPGPVAGGGHAVQQRGVRAARAPVVGGQPGGRQAVAHQAREQGRQ